MKRFCTQESVSFKLIKRKDILLGTDLTSWNSSGASVLSSGVQEGLEGNQELQEHMSRRAEKRVQAPCAFYPQVSKMVELKLTGILRMMAFHRYVS